jgi:hypothetical protein
MRAGKTVFYSRIAAIVYEQGIGRITDKGEQR